MSVLVLLKPQEFLPFYFPVCVCARALTVAALAAESLLEACGPVHARFAAWNHDLVGVGFGAARDAQRVSFTLNADDNSDGVNTGLLTRWGCTPASAYCLLLLPSVVSAGEKNSQEVRKYRNT